MNQHLSKKQNIVGKVTGIIVLCSLFLIAPHFIEIQKNTVSEKKEVRLLFVGDIMLSRQIGIIIEREQDPLYPFLRIKNVTEKADISFANLESIASKKGEDIGSIYSFRADPDTLKGLSYAGFDVVSVANNHAFDWGGEAFLDSQSHLLRLGIAHVGGGKTISDAHIPFIIEKQGTKFAYLGYSEFATKYPARGYPAVAPLDLPSMKNDIAKAKLLSDVVIVSIHWGTEYNIHASEIQKDIAHELIDAGVTIVIGHHPHVVQEVEEYHGGLIAYSLGNFVFDQNFSSDTRQGLMLTVTMRGDDVTDIHKDIVQFTKTFQPFIGAGPVSEAQVVMR